MREEWESLRAPEMETVGVSLGAGRVIPGFASGSIGGAGLALLLLLLLPLLAMAADIGLASRV